MCGRLDVVDLAGETFVSPKLCGGTGTALAGGPDKRGALCGGPRTLGGAMAGCVIWATKAAALLTVVDYIKMIV